MRRLPIVCIAFLAGNLAVRAHSEAQAKSAATGRVVGTVTCTDTNAPARFAAVSLERVPEEKAHGVTDQRNHMEFAELPMNATGTTDLEGHFVIDKVPPGKYLVIGILSGYMGPLARFDHDDLKQIGEQTRKDMLRLVPTVTVEAAQTAQVAIQLDHASELGGTVLYDDGSPAIHLHVKLLRKTKPGEITSMDGILVPGFGSETTTDDRGRYRFIGVPPGVYAIAVSMRLEKVQFSGFLGEGGLSIGSSSSDDGEVVLYSGNTFRKKDAKVTRVGEGEQLGGLDFTFSLTSLHKVQGTVTARRDGHPLNQGQIVLLYEDDQQEAQHAQLEPDGSFELPNVPDGRYLLRLTGGADTELIQRHEATISSSEERSVKQYGPVEIPLLVQADMTSADLAAPEPSQPKAP